MKAREEEEGLKMCSSSVCSEISTPQLPWKHRITLRFAALLFNASLRSDLTVNRRLLNFIDPKIPPNSTHSISSSDLTIHTSRDLFLRIFAPTPTAAPDESLPPLPIIFYFHGGGFAFGSADSTSFDMAARRFAKELHAVVISVNYRLAPDFRFPCQYDDGFDALKFIDEMDDDSLLDRVDPSRCFILGESAGGNLGHHVAVRASEYEFKRVKIIGFIASQPFFGGEERTESENRLCKQLPLTLNMTDWFWRAFLPAGENRDHAAANVNGPNGRDISGLEKFPATVIFAGGLDLLIDRHKCYYEGLKRMGKDVKLVVFSNAVHGFFGFSDLPEYSLMIEDMRDFIAKLT